MRGRAQTVAEVGGPGRVLNEENKPAIAGYFDDLIERLMISERSELHLVREAEERTLQWFDRQHRAHEGTPLTRDQASEVREYLEALAPGTVARWNARQLSDELATLESDIGGSGLSPEEGRALRDEAAALRTSLERSGHYQGVHDEGLARVLSMVRTGRTAWAEGWLVRLERYLGRHRWWL